MIAYITGLTAEQPLPSLTGAGAGLLLVRGWVMLRVRRRRRPRR